MASIKDLQNKYETLDEKFEMEHEDAIKADLLMAFNYEYPGSDTSVSIDTSEFTAVCPWTGLPDFGSIYIKYVPDKLCIELKSLKYYLMTYTKVGIVQEHAANRILEDLVRISNPESMTVILDYNSRGGIHTDVSATYDGS
mgnify:CR=1 FL=1